MTSTTNRLGIYPEPTYVEPPAKNAAWRALIDKYDLKLKKTLHLKTN